MDGSGAAQEFEGMGIEDKKKYFSSLESGLLITRKGGLAEIPEDQHRLIAVFEGGLAVVDAEARWSPQIKAVRYACKQAGHPIRYFFEADAPYILSLYEKDRVVSTSGEVLTGRQKQLSEILRTAAESQASDVHMRVLPGYTEVKIRVFGRMMPIQSVSESDGSAIIKAAFAVASDRGAGQSDLSFQQGALTEKSQILPRGIEMIRLQYSPTSDQRGALVMRLKYAGKSGETDVDSLGYAPNQITDIAIMRRRTNGLYIVAGKVSSGKTTTLQRILNKMYLEKRGEISLFSIEEPVELDLPGAIQTPVKIQPDGTDGFAEATKSSLRSDPNVIIMGEIRSEITAQLAMKAVASGHALWSTVHAGAALSILDRLADLGVEQFKLEDSSVVRGLMYQRLCGTICPHCRITFPQAIERGDISEDLCARLEKLFQKPRTQLYSRGYGCEHCNAGLNGRPVCAETVVTDPHLLKLYTDGKRIEMKDYWIRSKADGGLGGVPVLHHALSKVGAGLLDINEVEEEVDLLSTYEEQYFSLQPKLLQDIRLIEEASK